MPFVLAGFIVAAFVLSLITTAIAIAAGHRLNALDNEGIGGQIKADVRKIPNTGGIGITFSIIFSLAGAALVADFWPQPTSETDTISILAQSASQNASYIWFFLGGLLVLHVMGVIDDRKPLPWQPKLLLMLLVPLVVSWQTDTRVLSMFDDMVGGAWLSYLITAIWFAVVMNAMNFLDNMDGLAGGLGAIIAGALLVVAMLNEQWFIASGAACLLGATLGFMPFNFPKARVFMGDGGSLAIGFVVAFLTVRMHFVESDTNQPGWHQLFVPLVMLAVPLYDLTSVVIIRLLQGKSPFVGDLQHFSHRMARRGMGRTGAVIAIWVLTLITCIGAVVMARSEPWQGLLILIQTAVVLLLLAYLERGVPERES